MAPLLEHARRKVLVFSPRMDGYYFNKAQITQALAGFAAAHRNNRARFLVEDAAQTLRDNVRLIDLCRRLSDFVQMRQVVEEDRGLREMYIVVDDKDYVQQPDVLKPEYIVGTDARREAMALATRFERMWERSVAVPEIHPLGL